MIFSEFTSVDASQHVFVHARKQTPFFMVPVLPVDVEESQMIRFRFQMFGTRSVIKGNRIPVKRSDRAVEKGQVD